MSAWLPAHRRAHDTRPWQRAATCWTQAVLFLRWLIDVTPVHRLATDHGLSQATAYLYRYLHEAITVVASKTPTLDEVLTAQLDAGAPFMRLDGTLIPTAHLHTPNPRDTDLWHSGKHHHHDANIQVLTDPTGYPIWTSPAEPGNTHDMTAARTHALPHLYAAATGSPTLANEGFTGAGKGTHTPIKGTALHPDNRTCNRLHRAPRAPAECGNAILKHCRALRHVTLDPHHTGNIAAALVITTLTRGR